MAIELEFEGGEMGETEDRPDVADGALDELAKARALIASENARRTEQCSQEIQAVLDKYGMKLEAVGVLQLGPA